MCATFALTGIILGISGTIADIKGWWGSLAFLTNLFSGITGALFGIPFALVILQRLSYRQAEELQRRSVIRLKSAAANDLYSSTLQLLQPDGLKSISTALGDAIEKSLAAVKAVDTFPRPHEANLFCAEFDVEGFMRCAKHSRAELAKSIVTLHKLIPSRADAEIVIVDMMAKWRFLNDYVKPRVYETGGDWLDSGTFAHLHTELYEGFFNINALLSLREGTLDDFLATLDNIVDGSRLVDYDTVAGGISLPASMLYSLFDASRGCVQSLAKLQQSVNSMLGQLAQ